VEINKENEELIKEQIFSVFSRSLNEPNRQQVFLGQLSELIFKWCRDYLYFNIDNMGVEIFNISKRLLNDKSKANIPKEKEGFLKYLLSALKRGKNEYIRNCEARNQDDLVRMTESHLGRKLTEDEFALFFNRWYDFENTMKIYSISVDSRINNKCPYMIFLNTSNTAIILESIKTVLENKQERSRDCFRALLTLYLIDNVELHPVLDKQIIEACRQVDGKLKQYEIYQKYHPEASKDGSEAMASKNLKELLNDLKKYLRENFSEIF